MGPWRIDEERATASVAMRPGIPGLRLTVRGLRGTFQMAVGDDDRPDLRHPLTGAFSLALADLDVGLAAANRVGRALLADGDEVAIRGTIRDVARTRGHDHDDFGFTIDVEMRGETHTTGGTGTTGALEDGAVWVEGRTTVNPRALGIRVPKVLRARGDVLWRLPLVPAD